MFSSLSGVRLVFRRSQYLTIRYIR